MRRLVLLALLLAASSCAHRQATSWLPAAALRTEPGLFPDAPAVVLFRRHHLQLRFDPKHRSTRLEVHDAVWVRSEQALGLAEIRIDPSSAFSLEELRGRRIDPDGTVEVVPLERMLPVEQRDAKGRTVTGRAFRFPAVKVGSVLEYSYALSLEDQVLPRVEQAADGELPVRKYELFIDTNPEMVSSFKVYNSKTRYVRDQDDDRVRYVWTERDLPARPQEPLGPHWSFTSPWWSFRLDRVVTPTARTRDFSSWEAVGELFSSHVYENEAAYEGYGARLPAKGCGADFRCLLERALSVARERTHFAGFEEPGAAFRLQDALNRGAATSFEKAVLVYKLLTDAGMDVRVAGVLRRNSRLRDFGFPSPEQLNHFVVYVPDHHGLGKALWLDPSCEGCRVGELPSWSRGADALVFAKLGRASRWMKVDGEAVAVDGHERYTIRLESSGDARVEYVRTSLGEQATLRRRQLEEKPPQGEGLAAQLGRRFATATGVEATPGECAQDGSSCVDRAAFAVPGLAAASGRELLVPLSFLAPKALPALEGRRLPLVVELADRSESRVLLEPPPGYRWRSLPQAVSLASPGFRFQLAFTLKGSALEVQRRLDVEAGYYTERFLPQAREAFEAYAAAAKHVLVLERT